MARSVCKWVFWISVIILVLLVVFTLAIWAAVNLFGGMFAALAGHTDIDGIYMAEFLENFVGSPMFYAYMADGAAIAVSGLMLMILKKPHNM